VYLWVGQQLVSVLLVVLQTPLADVVVLLVLQQQRRQRDVDGELLL